VVTPVRGADIGERRRSGTVTEDPSTVPDHIPDRMPARVPADAPVPEPVSVPA
jgi:hypothetical protein